MPRLLQDGSRRLLQDGGARLLQGESAGPESPGVPGGTFRRARHTWPRVWRYSAMALATESQPLIAAAGDDREYAFDLASCPEVVGGLTIASGVIVGGAGLTIGTPAVLDAPFDGIPAGKGLKVRISGGTAGTAYPLACRATLSNGRVVVVPGRLVKVADYDA